MESQDAHDRPSSDLLREKMGAFPAKLYDNSEPFVKQVLRLSSC